jgi:hypothetical protein
MGAFGPEKQRNCRHKGGGMNGFFAGFALALLLWFAVFLYLRSYIRRRTSPDHILTLLQEEVRQLEADIDEKTEQNLQLLEEKIKSLREICAEAERRIAVYSRELEKREAENQVMTTLNMPPLLKKLDIRSGEKQDGAVKQAEFAMQAGSVKQAGITNQAGAAEAAYRVQTRQSRRQSIFPPPKQLPPEQTPSGQALSGQALPGQSPPGQTLSEQALPGQVPSGSMPEQTPPEPKKQPVITFSREPLAIKPPPMKDRVAELYRAGFDADLIAKRLGLSLGEVQLYFNLLEKPPG